MTAADSLISKLQAKWNIVNRNRQVRSLSGDYTGQDFLNGECSAFQEAIGVIRQHEANQPEYEAWYTITDITGKEHRIPATPYPLGYCTPEEASRITGIPAAEIAAIQKAESPPKDVVERVARAIIIWRNDKRQTGDASWEELPEAVKEGYRDQAKAAIAAMHHGAVARDIDKTREAAKELGVEVSPASASADSLSGRLLEDYNNERLLWKWAKHIDERLAQTGDAERTGLIRDKLRDFQRVCQPVPELPRILDSATKHAISDEISIECRSKSDVVQDVWDGLAQRGFVREPKAESGENWHPLAKLSAFELVAERFLEEHISSIEAFDEFMNVYGGIPTKIEDGGADG